MIILRPLAALACLLTLSRPGSLSAGLTVLKAPAGCVSFGAGVTALPNGNFVVTDRAWGATETSPGRGAVFLYDGATLKVISTLTGGAPGDFIGYSVTVLTNGNFVITSPEWNGRRGAITWADGAKGVQGEISAANSLIGTMPAEWFEPILVTALPDGNYVTQCSAWNEFRGAVTPGNGVSGTVGEISAASRLSAWAAEESPR
ncbi:MAG: hypothetical protein EOP86_23570 [Verrucomicrobiaceae bacterium]|nr:MAG: hypothetical protein EOP86_23570 [Verrucomicrobiaceae bacterium]